LDFNAFIGETGFFVEGFERLDGSPDEDAGIASWFFMLPFDEEFEVGEGFLSANDANRLSGTGDEIF